MLVTANFARINSKGPVHQPKLMTCSPSKVTVFDCSVLIAAAA